MVINTCKEKTGVRTKRNDIEEIKEKVCERCDLAMVRDIA